MTNTRIGRRVLGRGVGTDPRQARLLVLLAIVCAVLTGLLLAAEVTWAPAQSVPGLLAITASCGATLAVAVILLGLGKWVYGLNVAGLVMMALGMAAGAVVPDGLDAAAVLPLAGAILTLHEQRGRPLAVMFVLAYAAAMAGEWAAYVYGGASKAVGASWPQSLIESGFMLAFVYILVWWVGERWWSATASAQHAMASQRRLLEVNERLLSTLDSQGVLDLIADSLKPVLSYDNLTIYRVDRVAGVVRPMVARDRFAQLIMGTSFPLDRGVTGWVVAHGEAQRVNDIHLDARAATIPGTPDEPESLIVVPLLVRGEVVGTLNVGRMGGAEAHFSAGEFELARLFAGQASIAIQNAEVHGAVRNRAETDALTGLRNRGAFDARLEAVLRDESQRPSALIMIDLDGFKDYNDQYGHQVGDSVLQTVGRAIDSTVRVRDLSFRYGGDEFAIVLPRTGIGQAVQVADRVLVAIEEYTASAGSLTASAGVAGHPLHAADKSGLIAAADAALYRAKAAGGARTAVWGRESVGPRR